jgi:hypothetical protein
MSDTTITIKFEGDGSVLNELPGVKPAPTQQQPPQGTFGLPPRMAPSYETAGKLAHNIARDSGDTASTLADKVQEYERKFKDYRNTFEAMLESRGKGIQTGSGATGSTAQAAGQAGRAASAEGAAAGAAEMGAARGAGAGGAAGGVAAGAAVAVVALVALGAAAKKVTENTAEMSDQFREFNGRIAANASLIDQDKFLREMRRADQLAPEITKQTAMLNKLSGAIYDARTEIHQVLMRILNALLPLLETVLDFTKEIRAWLSWFNAKSASWFGEVSADEQAALDKNAEKARLDADKAWKTKDLDSDDDLKEMGNAATERLLRDFGLGAAGSKPPRIPPSRG